ncbi:hypothetical protein BD310DRAFT_907429 [Dichomitus squalens]|uniref:Uncharacterized protein n=1 Tax=Dichomitus squalens TaxID=114155 RepID=A0A4Q9PRG3_9APHY|nr:hypothetical protein BD310DRAFT_907429 [Dichomitus squalens]
MSRLRSLVNNLPAYMHLPADIERIYHDVSHNSPTPTTPYTILTGLSSYTPYLRRGSCDEDALAANSPDEELSMSAARSLKTPLQNRQAKHARRRTSPRWTLPAEPDVIVATTGIVAACRQSSTTVHWSSPALRDAAMGRGARSRNVYLTFKRFMCSHHTMCPPARPSSPQRPGAMASARAVHAAWIIGPALGRGMIKLLEGRKHAQDPTLEVGRTT